MIRKYVDPVLIGQRGYFSFSFATLKSSKWKKAFDQKYNTNENRATVSIELKHIKLLIHNKNIKRKKEKIITDWFNWPL